jgi:hypothetical protein
MNIENQVCSLELSKRLKELGVEQESYFYWYNYNRETWKVEPNGQLPTFAFPLDENCISAFTVAELGEILPNRVTVPNAEPFDNFVITINKFYNVNEDRSLTNNYILNYSCDSTEVIGIDAWMSKKLTKNIFDPNLANGMAKMLIYLLENGLIK